jgi:cell division transport system permease protein
MFTTFLRVIKYGIQNFFRNGWLSTATVIIMILALLVVGNLLIFSVGVKTVVKSIRDQIDIGVYFKDEIGEKDILNIQKVLEEQSKVEKVEYISKEKALFLFKEKHKDDPTINQAIQELNENPLAASLNIKARDPKDFSEIVEFINQNQGWQNNISKITYSEIQIIIDRLTQIFDNVQTIGWTVTIFLILTAIMVAFNTISLAIYSNREEIGIMRLVGASNFFIRGPYIVTGIVYGLIGGILSFIIIWFYIWFSSSSSQFYSIAKLLFELGIPKYFHSNFFEILTYQIFFGIFLGITSSVIAINRYLKI